MIEECKVGTVILGEIDFNFIVASCRYLPLRVENFILNRASRVFGESQIVFGDELF